MPAHKYISKKRIIYSLVLVVICLSIANIVVSASVSSTGGKLRELEEQARNLRHQNQLMEQEIVSIRSLTKLQYQAKELGFIEKPKMIMLSQDAKVAHVIDSRQL
jgi:cell division protein FtsL